MTVSPRTALAGIALLLLAACGGGASTGQDSAGPGQPSAAVAAEAGTATAVLSGTTLNGQRFDYAQRPPRATVLWFWAPWCTICRAEAPEVAAVAAQLGGDVDFIGIPGLGERPAMKQFVSDTGVGEFEHLVDADGRIWSGFGVVSQPAFAFIGADGGVEVVNGSMRPEDLERKARALLS